ncbi:MAG: CocE/NonD family hydrolase [Nitrospirota bacterium]
MRSKPFAVAARAARLGLVLTLTACAASVPVPDRSSFPVPDRHTALFDVPPVPLQPRIGSVKRRGTYTVSRLTFSSVLHAPGVEPVEAFLYLPNEGKRFPLVLLLPITRGDYFSQGFAVYFAEQGYACVRFRSQGDIGRLYGSPASLPLFRDLLRARVIDARRVLDWALTRQEIDGGRIALVGMSHGALVGSLLTAVEPRIRAAALLLGGGNLAGIIRDSHQSSLERIRDSLIAEQGLTRRSFNESVAPTLEDVDPLTYAPLVSPRKVLMINARFDRVIPRSYVEALWRGFGRPDLVWLPAGHYTAGLFSSYARHKMLAHFTRIFEEGP